MLLKFSFFCFGLSVRDFPQKEIILGYLLIKIGVEWGWAVEGCFLKKVDWRNCSVGEGVACLFEISVRLSGWVFLVRISCQNGTFGGAS